MNANAIGRDAWFVAILGLVIGAVLLIGSRSIAPPLFDPVGSAALPQASGIALIALGLLVLLQAWRGARRPAALDAVDEVSGDDPAREAGTRPATLGTLGLMGLYVAAMEWGMGFAAASVLFTSAAIPLVSTSWRLVPIAIGIALVLSFGSQWLFTQVFFVDLPGTR